MKKTISIHGKEYMPVHVRVLEAHESKKLMSITSEVLSDSPVVIKSTVLLMGQHGVETFTGISAADPTKIIEKKSPYEVAETSAVGRALGFAGFGIVDGIASADEVIKSEDAAPPIVTLSTPYQQEKIKAALDILYPSATDRAEMLAKILTAHKVDSIENLPINTAATVKKSLEKRVKEMGL